MSVASKVVWVRISAKASRSRLVGVTMRSLRLYVGGRKGRIGGRGVGSLNMTSE